jgi:hypothetical protein
MADKLSDKEIERRKKQAELNAAAAKPHENFLGDQGRRQARPQAAQGPHAAPPRAMRP